MSDGKTYNAEVFVTLKRMVNDPEGLEIRNGLQNLGYESVDDVRSGKYFEISLSAASPEEALAQVNEMCDRLLCNTVIEEYRVLIQELSAVN